ncbi:MAG: hypothetical protein Kow0069_28370 [Promethearchaeota archaeon]
MNDEEQEDDRVVRIPPGEANVLRVKLDESAYVRFPAPRTRIKLDESQFVRVPSNLVPAESDYVDVRTGQSTGSPFAPAARSSPPREPVEVDWESLLGRAERLHRYLGELLGWLDALAVNADRVDADLLAARLEQLGRRVRDEFGIEFAQLGDEAGRSNEKVLEGVRAQLVWMRDHFHPSFWYCASCNVEFTFHFELGEGRDSLACPSCGTAMSRLERDPPKR